MTSVPVILFFGKGSCNFSGGSHKAYGVRRGRGVVEHKDKGLILILILEMFDI